MGTVNGNASENNQRGPGRKGLSAKSQCPAMPRYSRKRKTKNTAEQIAS